VRNSENCVTRTTRILFIAQLSVMTSSLSVKIEFFAISSLFFFILGLRIVAQSTSVDDSPTLSEESPFSYENINFTTTVLERHYFNKKVENKN